MSDRIPDGFAEINFNFTLEGDPETMISSLGIELDGAPDFADIVGAIQVVSEEIATMLTNQYHVGPSTVEVGSADPVNPVYDVVNTYEGGVSADATTQNTAYLLQKRTGVGGRRYRGRMFIPGVPEGYVYATGALVDANFVDLAALAAFIGDTLSGSPSILGLVLFHSSAPFTPTAVVGLTAAGRVATQRRRMRP